MSTAAREPAPGHGERVRVAIAGGGRGLGSGLLFELVAALRDAAPGDLVALTTTAPIANDLEAWSLLTGHAIVSASRQPDGTRWLVAKAGEPTHETAPVAARDSALEPEEESHMELGSRLWLYTNFDCNLACDYCCVRSTPQVPRRALGQERIARIAAQAAAIGVRELMLTGGEPFLLPDIVESIEHCVAAAPTTVLTNAMRLSTARLASMASLPKDRFALQVSIDSPTPDLHDLHRGAGSWERAWRGAVRAREHGFRVRFAATVPTADDAERFEAFLDREGVAARDRVIRPVALRGSADDGAVVPRAGLVPEMTITDRGVYWHPVGADDEDMLVTPDILPLADALAQVRALYAKYLAHDDRVASVFHCA
jgi:organic radical activating enzyme